MQIISDLDGYFAKWDKCILTLGDFDGIHKGHRKLIEQTLKLSSELNLPSVLVTYDPSPKKILVNLKYDSNIYSKEEKIILLQEYPFKALFFLPFDKKMSKLTAAKFLRHILLKKLKAHYIVIGHDHCFGLNRRGNYHYLKLASESLNFNVKQIEAVKEDDEVVSSSHVRKLLSEGNIQKANRFLAAPYRIHSTVVSGSKRGSALGIPTANLHISKDKFLPKEGVYYCLCKYEGKYFKAVTNIGRNPTFKNMNISVEAHLLEFNQNIYGEKITLLFMDRLRNEEKFANAELLKKKIQKDILNVKLSKMDMNNSDDPVNFYSNEKKSSFLF